MEVNDLANINQNKEILGLFVNSSEINLKNIFQA